MPRIRRSTVELEELILSVSVPMSTTIIFTKIQTLSDMESYFEAKKEKEDVYSKRVEFEMARLLLKWAMACDATLLKAKNVDGRMKFYFAFNNMKDFITFKDFMNTNVQNALKH